MVGPNESQHKPRQTLMYLNMVPLSLSFLQKRGVMWEKEQRRQDHACPVNKSSSGVRTRVLVTAPA